MVAYALCAGCMTGTHDDHCYWIQKPPEGVMGGWACGCKSAEECAGNGEKLLRSLFGDDVVNAVTRARCVDCGARATFDAPAGRWVHEDPAVSLRVDHAARVILPDEGGQAS